MTRTTIITHVQHRVDKTWFDAKANQLGRTQCGILFAITDRYRYKPDRLVHQPARYRCRTCYGGTHHD